MNDIPGTIGAQSGNPSGWQIGYFFFRIMVGINLFFHGFMRVLTGLSTWEAGLATQFVDTFLPMPLVHVALYMIPIVEIVIGAMTILGLYTRWAIYGGVILMVVLLFGHTVRQNWPGTHIVMPYGIYYWILLVLQDKNWFALDNLRTAKG